MEVGSDVTGLDPPLSDGQLPAALFFRAATARERLDTPCQQNRVLLEDCTQGTACLGGCEKTGD
jgi:hypothetical protein